MQQKGPVSVLLSPLDWGLGHATRCIPIIKELISQGATVLLAAGGPQLVLLKLEFPQLETVEIPGYGIRYGRGILLKWGVFFRIPAILKKIKWERDWLNDLLKKRMIDAVISDNRYGLYNGETVNIFLTHQLFIQSGMGGNRLTSWLEGKILKWHYSLISKFSGCWVPDFDDAFSLAGKLSHPPIPPPVPLHYIGILSRFKPLNLVPVRNSLLILISGPEPQRTIFEKKVVDQVRGSGLTTVVLRGLPEEILSDEGDQPGVRFFNHLPAEVLNRVILESEFIIARSGYSTIMDLVKLKRSALLIPTPGQTEQEYLAAWLQQKNWMPCMTESAFDLHAALQISKEKHTAVPELPSGTLSSAVAQLIRVCTDRRPVSA